MRYYQLSKGLLSIITIFISISSSIVFAYQHTSYERFLAQPTLQSWILAVKKCQKKDNYCVVISLTNELLHLYDQKYFPNCQGLKKKMTCDRYLSLIDKAIGIRAKQLELLKDKNPKPKTILTALANLNSESSDAFPYYAVLITNKIYSDKSSAIKLIKNSARVKQIKEWDSAYKVIDSKTNTALTKTPKKISKNKLVASRNKILSQKKKPLKSRG